MKKNVIKICCLVLAVAVIAALLIAVRGCHGEEPTVPPTTAPTAGNTQSAPTEAETQPPTVPVGEVIPTVDRQSALAAAKKKNADTVAWLYIPGAEVDDPVMQAEDNGYRP